LSARGYSDPRTEQPALQTLTAKVEASSGPSATNLPSNPPIHARKQSGSSVNQAITKYRLTALLIISTLVLWIAYDVIAYVLAGNAQTESATIWRFSWQLASVDFIIGVLAAHLFIEYRPPSTQDDVYPKWVGYGQALIFFLTLGWLGWDLVEFFKFNQASPITQSLWHMTGHTPWIVLVIGVAIGRVFFQMHEPTIPSNQ
jgi:hypothetical protein